MALAVIFLLFIRLPILNLKQEQCFLSLKWQFYDINVFANTRCNQNYTSKCKFKQILLNWLETRVIYTYTYSKYILKLIFEIIPCKKLIIAVNLFLRKSDFWYKSSGPVLHISYYGVAAVVAMVLAERVTEGRLLGWYLPPGRQVDHLHTVDQLTEPGDTRLE